MKVKIWLVAIFVGYQGLVYAQDSESLGTNAQKFSYGVGLQVGQQLKKQGLKDLDAKAIAMAIDDVLNGRDLRIGIDEMRNAAMAYQAEMQAKAQAAANINKEAGDKFLDRNATREEVVSLASGLQYRVITEGTGEKPTETDTVMVHYRGRLLDGTEFDSSYGRGKPTELMVTQVISGWQQALQLMPVGSSWEVWIPGELAYGLQGAGNIGPNETLHFDIKLLGIKQGL
jgi:FKBP-type peptidyl-prolyl cis-trans isomerase FklB